MTTETDDHRTVLWSPSRERVERSAMFGFNRWVEREFDLTHTDYATLHTWSVDRLGDFWESLWTFFDVTSSTDAGRALDRERMPGADWFPRARLNYAENLLRWAKDRPDELALLGEHESLSPTSMTWRELEARTASLAAELRRLGVEPGDRVAAVLPHIPETVVSLLAVASIGAVWSVVNTDAGHDVLRDRFEQLSPKVLISVDGYHYNGAFREMLDHTVELRESLPTVEHVIVVDQYADEHARALPPNVIRMSDILDTQVAPQYEQVPFGHPLWVLFSSGTTGKPKGIVHSHGGTTLEAWKSQALHYDIRPGDRVYYAASTTWAVWNMAVNTMVVGGSLITYDGAPMLDGRMHHLELVSKHGVDVMGTGAAVLALAEQKHVADAPYDLRSLRTIMVTGSPLPTSTWRWVYEGLGLDLMLCCESGGTEVAAAFVGANPLGAVHLGESMGACLGVDAQAWDQDGNRVIGSVGELIIRKPMPSMPIHLLGDSDGERYLSTYFADFPGVWRHGDWVTELPDGAFVVHGRSDATINRGGIRMGSGDITQVVDQLDFVETSMVLGVELGDGEYFMPLFIEVKHGEELTAERAELVRRTIRERVSPRYVPDEIIAAPGMPRTLTGKLVEIPVKRLFQGAPPDQINISSVSNPGVLQWYVERSREFLRSRA